MTELDLDTKIGKYIRTFLADKKEIPVDSIEAIKFTADPSYHYSEETYGNFTCYVKLITTDGPPHEHHIYLNERDVCEMLNGVWANA